VALQLTPRPVWSQALAGKEEEHAAAVAAQGQEATAALENTLAGKEEEHAAAVAAKEAEHEAAVKAKDEAHSGSLAGAWNPPPGVALCTPGVW
jgi:hypothetical protein